MPELPPIFVAVLTGFLSGLILCIPVGPVNLTIINEGARRGFKWAALIGIGASVMEVIYCAIAFTGFSSIFANRYLKAGMEVFSFMFMVFLGIKFMTAKTVRAPLSVGKTAERIEGRIEEKLHPHSAFFIGLVRTMANPGVLLFWIFLALYFLSRDWVQPEWQSKVACIGGVAVSTLIWFVGLSWAVSLGHGRFSEKTLLRMEQYSGVGLLALGLIHGGHLAWQLAKHKM
jgi:threonine/homoserine/homoserine lactone efflux protein